MKEKTSSYFEGSVLSCYFPLSPPPLPAVSVRWEAPVFPACSFNDTNGGNWHQLLFTVYLLSSFSGSEEANLLLIVSFS